VWKNELCSGKGLWHCLYLKVPWLCKICKMFLSLSTNQYNIVSFTKCFYDVFVHFMTPNMREVLFEGQLYHLNLLNKGRHDIQITLKQLRHCKMTFNTLCWMYLIMQSVVMLNEAGTLTRHNDFSQPFEKKIEMISGCFRFRSQEVASDRPPWPLLRRSGPGDWKSQPRSIPAGLHSDPLQAPLLWPGSRAPVVPEYWR